MTLLLENPVFLKEMRSRMRGTRAYWMITGYVAVLLAALLLEFLGEVGPGNPFNPSLAPRLGRDFFVDISFAQLALGVLFAPAITAGSITVEREQRTFDILTISLIRARTIVLGKLASAMSFVVLLAIASVPLLSICFLLGGVDTREFAAVYAFILGTACFFGILGIFTSAISERTTTAVKVAYGVVALMIIGIPIWRTFQFIISLGSWNPTFSIVNQLLWLLNPFVAMYDLCAGPGRPVATLSLPIMPSWLVTLLLYAFLAVPMLIIAIARTKSWSKGEGRRRWGRSRVTGTQRSQGGAARSTYRSNWSLPFEVSNPVLKRELLSRLRRRQPSLVARIVAALLGIGVIGGYLYLIALMLRLNVQSHDWKDWWQGLAHMQLFLICVIAPVVTASAFTLEKEQRTIELLMLTRLTRWEICWGKLWGRLASVGMVLLLFSPMMLLCGALGEVTPLGFIGTFSLFATTSIGLAVLGLSSSALFRRTGTAVAVAVIATAGIMIFLLILVSTVAWAWFRSSSWQDVAVTAINPFVALDNLMQATGRWRNPSASEIRWVPNCLLYLGAALGLFYVISSRLDRLCRER